MKTAIMMTLATVFLLAGCVCVTSEYKTFKGTKEAIIDGKGGSNVLVDGMEIWADGEPPSKFKILGFIDTNRKTGDWIPASSVDSDTIKKARDAGGDAMIKLNSQSQIEEFYKAGGASFDIYSYYTHYDYSPATKKVLKYAVIKYVK